MAADSSLMPELLPTMWREAKLSDDRLMPPSQSEIDYAFSQLSSSDLSKRRYCFFIDGLDEFSGDISEGVRIIQNLAAAPNMKVLVSSRLLVQCAAAFSSSSGLELQHLTRPDMTAYVQEHVGPHANMKRMLLIQRPEAEQLIANLVNKASGVFLWLVLVCRSLRAGLDGSDRLMDLERRLDEHPQGLDELFRCIFEKIAPAHRDYAICMLRGFCEAYRFGQGIFRTLAVALADNHMFDPKVAMDWILAQENSVAMCQALQARLRSRCYGLFELHKKYKGHPCSHYFKGFSKRRLPSHVADQVCCDQCQLRNLVYSDVQLIHRSVLSYLENDGFTHITGKQNSTKPEHDHMALLSCLLMYAVFHVNSSQFVNQYLAGGPGPKEALPIMLRCIEQMDEKVTRQLRLLHTVLLRYTEGTFKTAFKTTANDLCEPEQRIYLAAEIGHEGLFQDIWNAYRHGPLHRLFKTSSFTRSPLLLHTFERSLLKATFPRGQYVRLPLPTLKMTHLLLSTGCDPNEPIHPPLLSNIQTVRTNLLRKMWDITDGGLPQSLELCRMYLQHGADVAAARRQVEAKLKYPGSFGLGPERTRLSSQFWSDLSLLLDEFEPNLQGAAAVPPTLSSQDKPVSSRKRPAPMTPITDGARKRVRSQDHEDLEGGSQASISQG